ncbi:MAG: MtrAB system histidine kinase MtrB [Candidatus Nanopelagicales bacterium]|jgi:two-component system, OmpR family, sensor histidine kinase MtrB|nr:MtrAB system histidine kinase MtrB [Candidatus Nanopelagicales bacterium]MDP4907170.1 MtrAB system histidine kinase MtrB [Candidatus Nanopelagicales bacterium]MDP4907921.1 MtrAB system histidine kinase MtrB [Candidatus Nanopelagicales bacterium]MDP4975575.1 MtrAB system histidine kinase MtrB [Candidatus Nanopelagicales bacterium]
MTVSPTSPQTPKARRSLISLWRRSLLLRVTATTLALSIVVMTILGFLLISRVTSGLLDSAQRTAVTEAGVGLADAQRIAGAAASGTGTASPASVVDTIVASLASRAGTPPQYDVLLLAGDTDGTAPERGTNLVSDTSVPDDMRTTVLETQRQSWTYTEIRYLDGRSVPGIVVGAPLAVTDVGTYELYYLFPLTDEQSTLDLVRGAVVGIGILLVLLLGAIAVVVTRQVVAPVRSAARVAEQFSEGHLRERMEVRGEDDLARLAMSFNDMAASLEDQIHRLEDLSLVQQRFVSDVSHELRTPLTTIRMAADLIFEERASYDPPTARAAELLQTQLDRFENLLTDLLEISRYDAGAAVLDLDTVDLAALVRRAVESARPLAERRGTHLVLVTGQDPCPVECDPRRVDRILRNLLDNAVEHGEGLPIDIAVAGDGVAVAVTVRDRGVGLADTDLIRVFDRFWRADPARARQTGGTGLGLAIALEDTRLHAGWLEAWGAPGEGACFRLTLPCRAEVTVQESPLPLVPLDQPPDPPGEDAPLPRAEADVSQARA